jgi:hypothetical protein
MPRQNNLSRQKNAISHLFQNTYQHYSTINCQFLAHSSRYIRTNARPSH